MSQVYKSYQKPLDHNDLWHNLDDNMVYVFDKNKNEWKPISDQDGSSNPGFSPVVSINKVGTKTEIKITDLEGDHIANIYDGEDGPKGDPGSDGVSPTIQAERVSNGVKLTITDKNGSHSAVLNDGIGDGSTVSTFADVPSDGKSYLRQNGTWVEGATKEELATLGSKVGELPNAIDTKSEETEIVCGVGDDKGYIAFGVDKDGELHSKNFNSKDTPKTKTNISDYPLAIGDEKGNIALAVNEDGEIVSQNFNSSETKKLGNVKCVEDSSDNILNIGDKDGNLIFFIDKYGNIKTHNFDSSSVKGEKKKIKILCYGNSWSRDAFSYLPALIESVLGKDNVEIQFGIMYIGGCTLQTHYERMTQPTSGDYGFDLWLTKNGKWTTEQQPFGYPLQN